MVRLKNRYIIIEINIENQNPSHSFNLKSYVLQSIILQKVQEFYGDFGVGAIRSGFCIKYCNPHTRIALIRVRHGPHKLIACTIPFITNINKTNVMLNTIYTGATVRKCFEFIRSYQLRKMHEDLLMIKGKPNYELLCKEYMKVNVSWDPN